MASKLPPCKSKTITNYSPLEIATKRMVFSKKTFEIIHPGRLTWNLKITQLKRKIIFQTIIFRFHVNLPGCSRQKDSQRIGHWSNEYWYNGPRFSFFGCFRWLIISLTMAATGFWCRHTGGDVKPVMKIGRFLQVLLVNRPKSVPPTHHRAGSNMCFEVGGYLAGAGFQLSSVMLVWSDLSFFWANYSDLNRGHPKWWLSEGKLLFQGI